nr:hypothetical protein [Desulfobacterales bacterium]
MKPRWIIKEVLTESFLGVAIVNSIGFLAILALFETGIHLSSLAAGLELVGTSRVIHPTNQWQRCDHG